MKKLLLLFGVVILSMNVFAQNKGDMYVLTSVKASFGKMSSYQIYNNHSSLYAEQPMDTQLGLGIGFGYFVANNFRLELVVSGYSVKSPREEASSVWLNDVNKGVQLNPNISYFVKLADRFYYTPEIGASFDFGKYVYEETVGRSMTYPVRGYSLYANLLAFQFKVSQRFSLGVNAGDVQYTHGTYYDSDEPFFESKSLGFRWNSGSIAAYFYF